MTSNIVAATEAPKARRSRLASYKRLWGARRSGSPRRLLLGDDSSCVRRGGPVHTVDGWRWQMGAEVAPGAHGRHLEARVVGTAGGICTREVVEGGMCVQKQPPAARREA